MMQAVGSHKGTRRRGSDGFWEGHDNLVEGDQRVQDGSGKCTDWQLHLTRLCKRSAEKRKGVETTAAAPTIPFQQETSVLLRSQRRQRMGASWWVDATASTPVHSAM